MPEPAAVTEAAARPRRADAKRNYDALLAAAASAFQQDVDTPLEEIARQAGVGIGTLYRHFPHREALILAVYQNEVDRLVDAAAELAGRLTPFDAVAGWLHQFVDYVATKRGLASGLSALSTRSPDMFEITKARMTAAMDMLVERAALSGAIRDDVRGEDLIRALSGICAAYQQPGWQDHAHRLVDLLLDGLRYGAPLG